MNPISISVAPTAYVIGKHYYDLSGTVELMRRLERTAVVDGVEFQNEAEWDYTVPPRDEREKRMEAWNQSQKYTIDEIASMLEKTRPPILSIHANRDVGICLCSGDAHEIKEGKRLIRESLYLAGRVGAEVCVFHLWDTWKEALDPGFIQVVLDEIAPQYPGVKAAVENVPTHLAGCTPFDLVKRFDWITLDVQWAALYDELDRFEALKERIVNVHLRGRLDGNEWVLDQAPFGFYEALTTIRDGWGYSGLLTMEPSGLRGASWENFVAAMASLKRDTDEHR